MRAKPYDIEEEKLEHIGHIEKRMGTRLLDIKKKYRKKLSDGKSLIGRNRLTDILKSKIQRYCSMAVRNNFNDLQDMKTAVWAIYFHLLS
ncbi:hypothetical protein TNCV_2728191 [Trichonephila clavipes]|nr:hypothetical protein TNCV_2728191 [Trichonephila clavipes]